MISLEAIACGRPVLVYASSEYPENAGFPLKDLKAEEQIARAVTDLSSSLWESEYKFLKEHHDLKNVESRLLEIYEELLKK